LTGGPGVGFEGIFQIAASISYRNVFPDSWGWMLASGIADLILAALIIIALFLGV